MKITAIKTEPVTPGSVGLFELVDKYVPMLAERSILSISSKVVAICEGRTVPAASADKAKLVRDESQYYLAPEKNPYHVTLTVNRDMLIASAGIDESNGAGYLVLWPKDPQRSANNLRRHLVKRGMKEVGVIITDSRLTPMRRGTIGVSLAHSGFVAVNKYVGEPDIFGRELHFAYSNVADGLAAAAVVEQGEGAESTPIAVIEGPALAKFQQRDPNAEELALTRIALEEDLYSEMLKRIPWDKRP